MLGYGYDATASLSMPSLGDALNLVGLPYNSNFLYPQAAAQEPIREGDMQFDAGATWSGGGCITSGTGTDADTVGSISPRSYTSDVTGSEVEPVTPATSFESGSERHNWSERSALSFQVIKDSSPESVPYMARDAHSFKSSGQRQKAPGLMISPISAAASRLQNGLPSPSEDREYPYSQQSRAYSNTGRSYALTAWNQPRAPVPAQFHLQDRLQASQTAGTQAQRTADDATLLEGKAKGLTYKEIKKQLHVQCAESTLRGRFRSLTKPRKDRVRKPVWQQRDVSCATNAFFRLLTDPVKVHYLNMYVEKELSRIDANHHQPLGHDQRLAKVQWKKVADFISASGGSYHFGNSTCKRKWIELSSGH